MRLATLLKALYAPVQNFLLAFKRRWSNHLIQRARIVFQPYTAEPITDEDAQEILDSLSDLLEFCQRIEIHAVDIDSINLDHSDAAFMRYLV
jgi:hypothetical protein